MIPLPVTCPRCGRASNAHVSFHSGWVAEFGDAPRDVAFARVHEATYVCPVHGKFTLTARGATFAEDA